MKNQSTVLAVLVIALTLTSCVSTKRTNHAIHTVTDTTHYVMSDTIFNIMVRDSMYVTHREEVTEHIVTLYDAQTGYPVRQDIDRSIRRMADSIVAHYLDSLREVIDVEADSVYNDTMVDDRDIVIGQASLSPMQVFFHRFGTIISMAIVIFMMLFAFKICRR